METLKKIARNQYFPAAVVLAVVVVFWTIAMFGGLSLHNNDQPPMATLIWMLFVYAAAVLTPLAGVLAAMDLIRRWNRSRNTAPFVEQAAWPLEQEPAPAAEPAAAADQPAPATDQPADQPATSQAHSQPPGQPPKKSAQAKQSKKAA